jgi:hypothetical protein
MGTRPPLRGSWVLRQGSTVVGAILVMAGAGLPWLGNYRTPKSDALLNISPFHLSVKWLVKGASGTDADPVKSVGMLLLLLVGLIVFGLVTPGRGVTVFAGAAAIAVSLAFALTIARSPRPFLDTLGLGVYLTLAGGTVAIAGALLGAGPHRHRR